MENSAPFHALTAILILLQFTTFMNSSSAARVTPSQKSTEFIKTSCHTTTYPQLCYTSLANYASKIQTSPKQLAYTSLSLTLETTISTHSITKKMSETSGLTPRVAAAIHDCMEELSDSVNELRRSIGEMSSISHGSNFGLQMNDIQTWVSAALTDEDTCMDGFSERAMNGKIKTMVRSHILKVVHMTSNALALVNNYASSQIN